MRSFDELRAAFEELKTEETRWETEMEEIKAKHKSQVKELTDNIESSSARHRDAITSLEQTHEAALANCKRRKSKLPKHNNSSKCS